jgi:hypothetical protein
VRSAEVHDEHADRRPRDRADGEPRDDRPHEVDGNPSPPEVAEFAESEQTEPEHDKGEGHAVVQPGLAGEREAHAVAIERVADLHVRREHRIRRRQNGPEQNGSAER